MADQANTPSSDAEHATATAYFAGGCFWGVEHYMQQLEGVDEVESGYMGGHIDEPSYEEVASQKSGHLETVRVSYDPTKISYREVAKRFFEIHDPTQKDGQGPDLGPEYLSAVFYASPKEKADVEALIALLRERGYDVATSLYPAEKFFPAEDRHQDYYQRAGKQPYCHARIKRFEDGS
jgi:peptide methionine sulfoxide reductase msrA/msrB